MKPGMDMHSANPGLTPAESTRPEFPGLRLGTNQKTGQGVFWSPGEQNGHCLSMAVLGVSGTGKTQLIQSLVTQLCRRASPEQGTDVLIFDYKGDYNTARSQFGTVTRAQVRRLRKLPFNPFDLSQQPHTPQLHVHTAMAFADMVAHAYSLNPIQKSTLVQSVLAAYAACGITADPDTWAESAPTFAQVYEEYRARPASQRGDELEEALEALFQFDLFDPDGTHALSPEELRGVMVLDMSGYPSQIQNLITAVVLGLLWRDHHRRFPEGAGRMEKLVVVDEADEILARDFSAVRQLLREGGAYGLGLILAARQPEYIHDADKPSVKLWAVHTLENPKKQELERIFPEGLPEAALQELRRLQRHRCVLKQGENPAEVLQNLPFFEVSADTRESYLRQPEPEPEKPAELGMPELNTSDFLASFDFAELELEPLEKL